MGDKQHKQWQPTGQRGGHVGGQPGRPPGRCDNSREPWRKEAAHMQRREGVQAERTAHAKTLRMEGEGMNEVMVLQEGVWSMECTGESGAR